MKKIILNLAVTLDGFIEGPNGEVDWCIMDDDMDFGRFIDSIDTILYGRVSYDAWGNFQPGMDISPAEKEMWEGIHAKKKFVFSRQHREHANATFIHDNIAQQVAHIKQQAGKDIWLYGGASLIKTFIKEGLIDVYKVSVHPVVLGAGKPLFEDIKTRIGLQLLETKVFKSGVVELTYAPVR
ncbi:MAG: dihydrofolate reductase [Chitinophaga sp.]|uniref:dihydrofolate reductase family protein n=1 Tax=Chitinophaga sp. TaxID=1869181 RepID=UPI001AFE2C39|nr:dihydrofolate reductase family protein [Chitinophaga sp.]MBO9728346.1 dihydrofolate reductase [Chitinophaga sp.]